MQEVDENQQHSRRRALIGPAVLFLIVVLFNWKLVLTNQYTWMEDPDIANQVLPWFQFQAGEISHGHIPLWDPSSWFGQPLFGQGQPGSAYPLNWLLFLLPLKNGWMRQEALHWYFVLIHYFAALSMYALCRDLRRSRIASIAGGCLFALSSYVALTYWPQMVNGAVWSPLVFLFLLRAERGEKPVANGILSGFCLGIGWLAGHHQMNLYVTLATLGLWVWICVRDGKVSTTLSRILVMSMVVALLASGLQTVPMAEYGRSAVRWTGSPNDPLSFDQPIPYSVHQLYSLKPLSLLAMFIPGVEGDTFNPYLGIVGFSLAVLGLVLFWRERQIRWLAVIGISGLLVSLGPNSLLHGILYSLVPLVEKARTPGTGTLLFSLCFAPLAAFGLDAIPNSTLSKKAGMVLWITGAVLGVSMFAAYLAKAPVDQRPMMTALAAILLASLLAGWRSGSISVRAGSVAVVGLILIELAQVTNYYLPSRAVASQNPYLDKLSQFSDLVNYVDSQEQGYRVEYDAKEIPFNIGDWHGIETSNSYLASVSSNVWSMDAFTDRAKDFFGVRYYFAKTPPRAGLREVFQGSSGVKIFENPTAYPRVWSVHRTMEIPNRSRVRPLFQDPNIDLRTTALMLGNSSVELGTCGSLDDDVQMPFHGANYVRITADLKCKGMVILTDTWAPGWRAYVDGSRVPLIEAYGGVRGVVVDAGSHQVEMRYRPWSVMLGGLMTLAATVIAGLAAIRARRG